MDAVFAADSICKRFGQRPVLTSASVWAVPGRVTALFGRNGSGKTTLLRIGAGLLAADAGAVHFAGGCWERPRLAALARRGLFFLPFEGLLPWRWTVGQALHWLAASFGGGARLPEAVRWLRLEPYLDLFPWQLSGGEHRRAEFAAVLTRQPACLLADEPFRGIAPIDAGLVSGVLRSLAAAGCAIITTGHETRTLLAAADDVIWMVAGTTHHLGTPAEAVRSYHFRRDYLVAAAAEEAVAGAAAAGPAVAGTTSPAP